MSPQHVDEMEERWPAGRARVDDRKNPLEKTIEITGRDGTTAEFQKALAAVPPGMNDPGWKHGRLTGAQKKRLLSTPGCKRPRRHDPFLALVPVDVSWRPLCMWRQRSFDSEDRLAIVVTHPAQSKTLPRVAICQLQDVIHENRASPILSIQPT